MCLWDVCKNPNPGPLPRSIPAGTILDYLLIPITLIKWRELTFLHKQNTKCRETPGREHPAQQSRNPSGKLDTLNHTRFVLPFFLFKKRTIYFYFYSFTTQALSTHLIENVKVAICITSQADSFSLWHQEQLFIRSRDMLWHVEWPTGPFGYIYQVPVVNYMGANCPDLLSPALNTTRIISSPTKLCSKMQSASPCHSRVYRYF